MSFQVGRGCLPLIITRQKLSDTRRRLSVQLGPRRGHESAWCLLGLTGGNHADRAGFRHVFSDNRLGSPTRSEWATPRSIVRRIYYPDHSLRSGMYVDVPDFDRLLVAAPITLEGLDHVILKPKQLDGVVAVNVDEVLGHVAMALSKKS